VLSSRDRSREHPDHFRFAIDTPERTIPDSPVTYPVAVGGDRDGPRLTTAVLHYKPKNSTVPGEPDHHVVVTDRWVVYPFKSGA
jgi:hypothetical protein